MSLRRSLKALAITISQEEFSWAQIRVWVKPLGAVRQMLVLRWCRIHLAISWRKRCRRMIREVRSKGRSIFRKWTSSLSISIWRTTSSTRINPFHRSSHTFRHHKRSSGSWRDREPVPLIVPMDLEVCLLLCKRRKMRKQMASPAQVRHLINGNPPMKSTLIVKKRKRRSMIISWTRSRTKVVLTIKVTTLSMPPIWRDLEIRKQQANRKTMISWTQTTRTSTRSKTKSWENTDTTTCSKAWKKASSKRMRTSEKAKALRVRSRVPKIEVSYHVDNCPSWIHEKKAKARQLAVKMAAAVIFVKSWRWSNQGVLGTKME